MNLSRLGADAGITHPTAKSWLSVLEASFLTFRLRPWHHNLGKRITKAPKLGFWDSGLLCWLLGIRDAGQLVRHPLRGLIFESWAVAELLKQLHHRGERVEAFYYASQGGIEVDLLLRRPGHWLAIEFKSGTTVAADFFSGLRRFQALADGATRDGVPMRQALVYGGDRSERRGEVQVVPWHGLSNLLDRE